MLSVNKVSFQHAWPRATFFAAYGDTATGQWHPAQAVLDQGMVTLWILTPTGWAQAFSLPAAQVRVSSATHRITLVAGGRNYPLLADQASVARANALTTAGLAASMLDLDTLRAWTHFARFANQGRAADAFAAAGGHEFLAAMRSSGASVSRTGYGAIMGIGCGCGLLIALGTLAIMVAVTMG